MIGAHDKALTSRSRLTEGSAHSIVATLDWLEPVKSASADVRFRRGAP